jgi:hypothetical protein
MAGPDYTSLLAALSGGVDKAAAETDPFNPLASFADQFSASIPQLALKTNSGLGAGAIAGLLSGLVGGVSHNLSTDYRNEQKDYAQSAIQDLLAGKAISQGDMTPSVFNTIRDSQNAVDIARAQHEKDLEEETARQIKIKQSPAYGEMALKDPQAQALEAKIYSGEPLTPEENLYRASLPIETQRLLTQAQQMSAIEGRSKASLDMRGKVEEGKNTRFELGQGLKLSSKLETAKVSQNFQEASGAWDEVQQLAQLNTQSADIGMIKAAARVMNPGATVREQTFDILTKNPNNYTLQLQDFLSEIQGQGQLSAEHKAQLIEAMKPFISASANEYRNLVNSQLDTYSSFGQDASRIKTLPMPHIDSGGGSSGLPGIGETFQGGKVLSIKRIQ